MLAVHIGGNYIFMEVMKDYTLAQMIETYQKTVDRMKEAGSGLKKYHPNNQASAEFKQTIKNNGMKYKVVALGTNHRVNIAEGAIQMAKDHFMAIIVSVDKSFPIHLQCRLL